MTDPVARSAVDQLADRIWDEFLVLSPTTATMAGDARFDDRLPDPGPAGRAAMRDLATRAIAGASAIPDGGLSVEEAITRDVLRVVGELLIEEDDQRVDALQVIDAMYGPQTLLPTLCMMQPADTPERLEAFLERIRAYPAYMAANIELLADARTCGMTAPRIVAERVVAQIERMLAVPAAEAVVANNAQVANEADRERIRQAVAEFAYPADRAFLEAVSGAYFAETREDPGICWAPNGAALYRTQIRHWTSLDLDPKELHRIGLDELETIESERRVISRAAGFGDDTVAYRAHLAADPANVPVSREAVVARASEDIARAMAVAPRFFGRLPKATCVVTPVEPYKEKDAPFAYYFPPTPDGSRPGTYYVNTYDLPSRTFSRLASTTYHEAVPGHHFQIALDTENPDLGEFRRFGARMLGGAHVEGWGLYSERLADELGLYRNEAERFGMLDAQAWRAARLVVDTGLHALRWTRQQSIDQLLAAGLTNTDAIIETDRYIAWPGQALTYKVGQREIERLRHELEARDGDRFDIRSFHDHVISHGALPLATLSRELPGWVKPRD